MFGKYLYHFDNSQSVQYLIILSYTFRAYW